jgi:hypothetical protein
MIVRIIGPTTDRGSSILPGEWHEYTCAGLKQRIENYSGHIVDVDVCALKLQLGAAW